MSPIPDEWRFQTSVSSLYRLIDIQGAVRTPDGTGTLLMAHSYPKGCMVTLTAERRTAKDGTRVYTPCRYYDAEEVEAA